MKTKLKMLAVIAGVLSAPTFAQETSIETDYLMTIYAPLAAPQAIDSALVIFDIVEGGWVEGPDIKGKLLSPAADWVQVRPDGTAQLDVRATIETDDGALVYLTYSGIVRGTDESRAKQQAGEVVTHEDTYFITAVRFRTSADRYAWLNHIQCVGKMVEQKAGAYVKYDIFAVR